ncbi:7714_t:CDS:1 [Acaulospora morrowiae]|uniref:7714_t:CDS:1 n=1 Tax=Acaulospora morrowiae TaxID=94023 RepID=A0A9N9CFA9_9GLOM|nr:7714_t:CDS:1 [Acaulospora morrowiae]
MNAFLIFSRLYRQENPGNRFTPEEIGLKWRSMGARDRERYFEDSNRMKNQFILENPDFKEKRNYSVRRKNRKFMNNSPEKMREELIFKEYTNKPPEKMQEK